MIKGIRVDSARVQLDVMVGSALLVEVSGNIPTEDVCHLLANCCPALVAFFGPDSSNLHDLFDRYIVAVGREGTLTTWDNEDTPENVVEDFIQSSAPVNATSGIGYIIEIGNGHLLSAAGVAPAVSESAVGWIPIST